MVEISWKRRSARGGSYINLTTQQYKCKFISILITKAAKPHPQVIAIVQYYYTPKFITKHTKNLPKACHDYKMLVTSIPTNTTHGGFDIKSKGAKMKGNPLNLSDKLCYGNSSLIAKGTGAGFEGGVSLKGVLVITVAGVTSGCSVSCVTVYGDVVDDKRYHC
ncbi:unnamed protein product [Colias eurytheme]|nr:unnamed protein product [Colias eurytheme]